MCVDTEGLLLKRWTDCQGVSYSGSQLLQTTHSLQPIRVTKCMATNSESKSLFGPLFIAYTQNRHKLQFGRLHVTNTMWSKVYAHCHWRWCGREGSHMVDSGSPLSGHLRICFTFREVKSYSLDTLDMCLNEPSAYISSSWQDNEYYYHTHELTMWCEVSSVQKPNLNYDLQP